MSNLVIKIKHNINLTDLLSKAVLVAKYAIKNRMNLSSKNVSHIGLPSAISNQILRKYGKNKRCKKINPQKIKLIAPNQSIKIDNNIITITPLKIKLLNESKYIFIKINQIELDNIYAYVCFEQQDQTQKQVKNWLGIDLNATSHCAVVANPQNGKVIKLGKQAPHIHEKYKKLRASLQRKKLYKKLKQTKGRESRIVKDINHKIANKIIQIAIKTNSGIKLEKLTGIRDNKKNRKSFRYALHSWSYYQLGMIIAYKALLAGIPLQYIAPEYTSKNCSRCNYLGKRNGKFFKCVNCKHIDHADANAAFNIAVRLPLIGSSKTEIVGNGETGAPMMKFDEVSCKTIIETSEPPKL
jgi:putative transposase